MAKKSARPGWPVAALPDAMDYTPYEGRTITGWPTTTLVRGEVVAEGGDFVGAAGKGQFLKCDNR
jgi:dihydropyrimidinase